MSNKKVIDWEVRECVDCEFCRFCRCRRFPPTQKRQSGELHTQYPIVKSYRFVNDEEETTTQSACAEFKERIMTEQKLPVGCECWSCMNDDCGCFNKDCSKCTERKNSTCTDKIEEWLK